MRKNIFIAKAFVAFICMSFTTCKSEFIEDPENSSFNFLSENFASPPVDYSTSPFWVWNDLVTKEVIKDQLKAFSDQNIKQVFVHPRPGLITEYLSDEWFDLFQYATQEAKALGMKLWLYDENSFPSGFAGGHVQDQMPESYNQGDAIQMLRGDEITGTVEDYLVVFIKNGDSFEKVDELPSQLVADHVAFKIVYEPNSGWYGGFSYVDLLIPGVTEKFIDVTMEGYEKTVGDQLGNLIPGIFTDEPNISPRGTRGGVRYSPVLFEEFEKKWKYDLKEHLPSLFIEAGDYKTVRYHYYRLLLELFIERWSKPWFEYTENNNLVWTGHYWEHGWPSPHHGGDNMAMAAWHQMPGIDMLFNSFEQRPDQFGNVRAVKEISSVANQLGRKRTLSETYGGSGWDLSFMDMKRLGDWQHTLGVNFMNQHLSYMTLKGRRKGDFPQSIMTHAPYWQDYGIMAEYYTRVSFALSQGAQLNKTLILEPTTTAWMYYSPISGGMMMDTIEGAFRNLVDKMEKYQLEYDLGAENMLQYHGGVDGNKFIIGQRDYTTLVLPPFFENIDSITWGYLKEYVENGGRVFSFTIPRFVNGGAADDPQALYDTHDNWKIISSISETDVLNALKAEDFGVKEPDQISGKVYHMRRIFEDGMLLFWSNFNREGNAHVEFSAEGSAVSLLDPLTGEIFNFPVRQKDGMIEIELVLAAGGSKMLFIHKETPAVEFEIYQDDTNNKWNRLEPGLLSVQATSLNSLTLDYLDLTIDGRTYPSMYFSAAADSAYKINGLEQYGRTGYNPWAVAVQYRTNIIDMADRFDENSGFAATYKFEIDGGYNPLHLQAVVEWAHLYDISINGNPINPLADTSWLDHSFHILELTDYVQPGINELTLSVSPMHIHAEIEPIYLRGDFTVRPDESGFEIYPREPLQTGSWVEQGMPFYSQSVKYSRSLNVEEGTKYKLMLNEWSGTVARILVNNEQVGIIGWLPFEFELTPYLEPGEQKITVEVVGSLQNLLGPHHGNQRNGIVTPWSWFYADKNLPPGSDYHFKHYGLMSDFDIYVQN